MEELETITSLYDTETGECQWTDINCETKGLTCYCCPNMGAYLKYREASVTAVETD